MNWLLLCPFFTAARTILVIVLAILAISLEVSFGQVDSRGRTSSFARVIDFTALSGWPVRSAYEGGIISSRSVLHESNSTSLTSPSHEYQAVFRENNRPVVAFGGASELGLTDQLGIEVSVLWRRYRGTVYSLNSHRQPGFSPSQVLTGDYSLDLPVLLKYRLGNSRIRPFVGGGMVFQIGGIGQDRFRGAASTVGVEYIWNNRLKIAPQLRHTYWGIPASIVRNSKIRKSQFQFLVGISFSIPYR